MSTTPLHQWPDDQFERIEAKLDAYRERHVADTHAMDKRVTATERDIATFKAAGAIVGTGALAAMADLIKRKFGIGQ
jgi:deoxyhypusine synthase